MRKLQALVTVLFLLTGCAHFRSRPEITFLKPGGEEVQIRKIAATEDLSQERAHSCQIAFATSYPQYKAYESLGKIKIPEGAYGDGSEMAYTQIEDLIERIKPFACRTEANRVVLIQDSNVKGIREAELIKVNRPRS